MRAAKGAAPSPMSGPGRSGGERRRAPHREPTSGSPGSPWSEASSSPSVVEEFVRSDPYLASGVVARWRVRPWTAVVETTP